MEKDKTAQVTIRGLNRMNKKEVRQLVTWLKSRTRRIEHLIDNEHQKRPWLIERRNYAPLFKFSLMR